MENSPIIDLDRMRRMELHEELRIPDAGMVIKKVPNGWLYILGTDNALVATFVPQRIVG